MDIMNVIIIGDPYKVLSHLALINITSETYHLGDKGYCSCTNNTHTHGALTQLWCVSVYCYNSTKRLEQTVSLAYTLE